MGSFGDTTELVGGGGRRCGMQRRRRGERPSFQAGCPFSAPRVCFPLQAAAVEFLDALPGAFSPELWAGQQLPLVHVYTFAKGEDELAGGCRVGSRAGRGASRGGGSRRGRGRGAREGQQRCACMGTALLRSVSNARCAGTLPSRCPPTVTSTPLALAGLRRRVEASLGGQLEEEPEVTVIRDVAPQKVCVGGGCFGQRG